MLAHHVAADKFANARLLLPACKALSAERNMLCEQLRCSGTARGCVSVDFAPFKEPQVVCERELVGNVNTGGPRDARRQRPSNSDGGWTSAET